MWDGHHAGENECKFQWADLARTARPNISTRRNIRVASRKGLPFARHKKPTPRLKCGPLPPVGLVPGHPGLLTCWSTVWAALAAPTHGLPVLGGGQVQRRVNVIAGAPSGHRAQLQGTETDTLFNDTVDDA